MAIRRRLSIFSLAILEVISSAFAAVELVILIINHETNEQREFASDDVLSNNRQLDYRIQLENEELEELKTVLSSLQKQASQIEIEIVSHTTSLGHLSN